MPYKTIFTTLALTIAATMTTVVLMHDQVPRWQGWICMGAALLTVVIIGLVHSRGLPRRA